MANDPLEEKNSESNVLWYLAYGSNLSSRIFLDRRGIHPLSSENVIVYGLELSFDLPGIPYNEPRFANCRIVDDQYSDDPQPETYRVDDPWTGKGKLIGVAYLLTKSDFSRIISTEGGGASYQMIMVDAFVLPEMENRVSFENDEKNGRPESAHIKAYTLIAPPSQRPYYHGKASLRYLSIVREGAKERKLPQPYITFLQSLSPYTPYSIKQKIARRLFALVWLPALFIVMFLGMMASGKKRQSLMLLFSFAIRNLGIIKDETQEEGALFNTDTTSIGDELDSSKALRTTEGVESEVELAIESTVKSGLSSSSTSETIKPIAKVEYHEAGQSPEWVQRLNKLLMRSMWMSYDIFWKRIFGDGEGVESEMDFSHDDTETMKMAR